MSAFTLSSAAPNAVKLPAFSAACAAFSSLTSWFSAASTCWDSEPDGVGDGLADGDGEGRGPVGTPGARPGVGWVVLYRVCSAEVNEAHGATALGVPTMPCCSTGKLVQLGVEESR